MAAVFIPATTMTLVSSGDSTSSTNPYPASNVLTDDGNWVWRPTGTATVVFQTDGTPWDSLVIVGNLKGSSLVTIKSGPTAASVAANGTGQTYLLSTSPQASMGAKPIPFYYLPVSTAQANTFVSVTLDNFNGDKIVNRILVGKRIEADGIDVGAEHAVIDSSVIDDGNGWSTVEEYWKRLQWKVTMTAIPASAYWSSWFPFFKKVGKSKGFGFVPDTDDADFYMQMAIFGRITTDAKGTYASGDLATIDLTILSTS